ncbi:MAG: tripartite tricarboxylate transporter substrate binding protein [Burkholderiales bacterium]|nr:tripartite tricarboxylate transporter substrate binding protein [Burkholderiales bacterium]
MHRQHPDTGRRREGARRAHPLYVVVPLLLVGTGGAFAQQFPARPVRLVVAFPAGGTLDIVARTLATPLSRAFGQSVVVDNRPGGGTVIGTDYVAKAPADGHTVLLVANSFTINPAIRPKLPYDTLKDFTAVAGIADTPIVIAVHPSVPVRNLRELIDLARRRPGELNYASTSLGAGHHLAAEVIKLTAKIDVRAVHYAGTAPAGTAVMGGHVGVLFSNVPDVAPHVRTGRLRALAVGSTQRNELLPEVPTVAESAIPGFDWTIWYGAVTQASVPREAMGRLSGEFLAIVQSPALKEALGKLGFRPSPRDPDAFNALLRSEVMRNERIARAADIRVE